MDLRMPKNHAFSNLNLNCIIKIDQKIESPNIFCAICNFLGFWSKNDKFHENHDDLAFRLSLVIRIINLSYPWFLDQISQKLFNFSPKFHPNTVRTSQQAFDARIVVQMSMPKQVMDSNFSFKNFFVL